MNDMDDDFRVFRDRMHARCTVQDKNRVEKVPITSKFDLKIRSDSRHKCYRISIARSDLKFDPSQREKTEKVPRKLKKLETFRGNPWGFSR